MDKPLNRLYIFIIRAFLGAAFAVILWRWFSPNTNASYVAGLAILLVGLAYVSEYFRNRKSRKALASARE